ncbi:hypothetical protein EMIT0P4_230020 [Pseudomonas sp. IT-P4]
MVCIAPGHRAVLSVRGYGKMALAIYRIRPTAPHSALIKGFRTGHLEKGALQGPLH